MARAGTGGPLRPAARHHARHAKLESRLGIKTIKHACACLFPPSYIGLSSVQVCENARPTPERVTPVYTYLHSCARCPAAVPWALERLREDLPALIEYDECKQTKCKRCSACKERIESAALDSFQLIGKRVCGHDAFRCAAGKGKVRCIDSNGLHRKLAQTWTQHHRLRHEDPEHKPSSALLASAT